MTHNKGGDALQRTARLMAVATKERRKAAGRNAAANCHTRGKERAQAQAEIADYLARHPQPTKW